MWALAKVSPLVYKQPRSFNGPSRLASLEVRHQQTTLDMNLIGFGKYMMPDYKTYAFPLNVRCKGLLPLLFLLSGCLGGADSTSEENLTVDRQGLGADAAANSVLEEGPIDYEQERRLSRGTLPKSTYKLPAGARVRFFPTDFYAGDESRGRDHVDFLFDHTLGGSACNDRYRGFVRYDFYQAKAGTDQYRRFGSQYAEEKPYFNNGSEEYTRGGCFDPKSLFVYRMKMAPGFNKLAVCVSHRNPRSRRYCQAILVKTRDEAQDPVVDTPAAPAPPVEPIQEEDRDPVFVEGMIDYDQEQAKSGGRLPKSNYRLKSDEDMRFVPTDFWNGDRSVGTDFVEFLFDHTIGGGTCSDEYDDYVGYEFYQAPSGSTGYTQFGSQAGERPAQFENGSTMFNRSGCYDPRGSFVYRIKMPTGFNKVAVCVRRLKNNGNSRHCQVYQVSTAGTADPGSPPSAPSPSPNQPGGGQQPVAPGAPSPFADGVAAYRAEAARSQGTLPASTYTLAAGETIRFEPTVFWNGDDALGKNYLEFLFDHSVGGTGCKRNYDQFIDYEFYQTWGDSPDYVQFAKQTGTNAFVATNGSTRVTRAGCYDPRNSFVYRMVMPEGPNKLAVCIVNTKARSKRVCYLYSGWTNSDGPEWDGPKAAPRPPPKPSIDPPVALPGQEEPRESPPPAPVPAPSPAPVPAPSPAPPSGRLPDSVAQDPGPPVPVGKPGPPTWSVLPPGNGDCLRGEVSESLGKASGDYQRIGCLEVRNSGKVDSDEVAFSGIPLRKGLLSTQGLVVVGPGEVIVPSQFQVLARWNGRVDDPKKAIQWVQVVIPASVGAGKTTGYELRWYKKASSADPSKSMIVKNGDGYRVDTGVATFQLDPDDAALVTSIEVTTIGGGKKRIYSGKPHAGPRLVMLDGMVLDRKTPGAVSVDEGTFRILEAGPVRVVVQQKGHFVGPNATTMCARSGYQGCGFTSVMTFFRGRRDIELQFQYRNECGTGASPPWTDELVEVQEVAWVFPLDFKGNFKTWVGGSGPMTLVQRNGNQKLVVEQRKGGGSPWRRRARMTLTGSVQEQSEFFERPVIAIGDNGLVASAQMPWMRYREPQGLRSGNRTLELLFISEKLPVGEAVGIWNQARINIRTETSLLQQELTRSQTAQALERGLLVGTTRAHVNWTKVLPNLGSGQETLVKSEYLKALNQLHDDTVRPGGQWDRAKTYGTQLWPDTVFDRYLIDRKNPYENDAKMNYWNPSGAELLEYFRSGDPKWAWEMALPASWLQMYSAYYNTGDWDHGISSGFAVTSGGTGEGQWHRSGKGSSDYAYNRGMYLAYLVRPSVTLRDRFMQAGATVIRRYNIPRAQQESRERFVNYVVPTRQVLQHFEMLMNCAQFVPGSAGQACLSRLHEVVGELIEENIRAGVVCLDDIPRGQCSGVQQFMVNSMHYAFFHRYYRSFGDTAGPLKDSLVKLGTVYYEYGLQKESDRASIAIDKPFASSLQCTLAGGGDRVSSCQLGKDGDNRTALWALNKPHTLSLLFLAQELDPSIGLCDITKDAHNDPSLYDNWASVIGEGSGYWKGASQVLQGMIFSVGGYDSCRDRDR